MKLKYLLSFFVLILVASSCLKQKSTNFANQSSSAPNTVDFPYQTLSAALNIVSTPTPFTFYVEGNSVNNSIGGATVTIAKNTAIIIAAGKEFLPDSVYTLVNSTAVLDPKTAIGTFQLSINTTKINLTHSYAVGFTITSTTNGTIATNTNNIIINVGAKNKWDGEYELKGHHNRDPYTFSYDQSEALVTVDGTSDAMYWDAAASVGHPIGTGPGVVSWYGASIAPVIVFDPNTNLITNVYNGAGPATPITIFTGAGAGTGRFDPATKTIYVYWNYNGNPLRAFFDTLYYVGPRK